MMRDTQFAGFAALLLKEIDEAIDKEADRAERGDVTQTHQEFANMLGEIIAHRAYDLVEHALVKALDAVDSWSDPIAIMCEDDFIERIPDLTTWPEEGKGDDDQ